MMSFDRSQPPIADRCRVALRGAACCRGDARRQRAGGRRGRRDRGAAGREAGGARPRRREITLSDSRVAALTERDRRHQEGPRQHHRSADPGRQDRAQARRGHRGHHRPARRPEGAPGGDPPVAVGPARRARRGAGRAAAHGPQPAAGAAGQAGGRAVVGAQRHPARRRGAGAARADRSAARRSEGTVARHRLDRGRARPG